MPSYGVTTTSYGQGNRTWMLTGKGRDTCRTVTLDISAFTANTHYPNGYLPAGLVLGKITASGMYAPYIDANSDGTQTAELVLFNDQYVDGSGNDIVAACMTEGDIIVSRLPSGNGLDTAGKTDLAKRFTFV